MANRAAPDGVSMPTEHGESGVEQGPPNFGRVSVSRQTSVVLYLATLVFTVLLFVVILVEIWTKNANPVVDLASNWASAGFLSFLIVVASTLIFFFVSFADTPLSRHVLKAYGAAVCAFIFCAVNASGGLTNSPFVSLYAVVPGVALTVTKTFRPLVLVTGFSGLFLTGNFLIEMGALGVPGHVSHEPVYLGKHWLIHVVTLVTIVSADFAKHQYPLALHVPRR